MSIPTMTFQQLQDIVSKQKYDIDNTYDKSTTDTLSSLFNTYNTISNDLNNGKIPFLVDERQKQIDEEAEKMKKIVPSFISDVERQGWQLANNIE
jgi:hypothetical protein